MDAGCRKHKHRITRWMGRFVVVLSLVASWEVQAAVESVSPVTVWYPYNSVWIDALIRLGRSLGPYPTDTAAAQAGLNAMQYETLFATTVSCNGQGWCNSCTASLTWGTTVCFYNTDDNNVLIISGTGCPVPTVNPTVPYTYNYATGMCERTVPDNITYTLSLVGMSGEVEPSGTMGGGNANKIGYVSVIDSHNQPKSGTVVRVTVNVDTSSGGHDHGERYTRRDRGTISGCAATNVLDAYDCTTSSNGSAQFTFNAPQASGIHSFTATCVNPACTNSASGNIDVKVGGLATIPASQFYTFVGGEADKPHHDNHYLTSEAASVLWRLAGTYYFKYRQDTSVPLLQLNDASLILGGLFDVKGNWAKPHAGHRKGSVIDIRANALPTAIPESLFTDFEKLAKDTILADGVTSAKAQLHCSTGFDPATNCVGDDNRHYHVILLGVDQ
jgi:hypothetical protein